jgi:hypothetical protein
MHVLHILRIILTLLFFFPLVMAKHREQNVFPPYWVQIYFIYL